MEEHLTRHWATWMEWTDVPAFLDLHAFISRFKARNRFSSRRAHYKRRLQIDPARCAAWQQEIQLLLDTVDHSRIDNADETSWRLYPQRITTWAPTGSDGVSIAVTGQEKESLTVMATIRANGSKEPLSILAKGKTARVQKFEAL
jgi:hypothetical protein